MHEFPDIYRQESGAHLIEIRLNTLDQLFNSLDPAPFHSKDLDAEAEEYIVGALSELPSDKPARLVFYLPAGVAQEPATKLADTIHNYFAYREQVAARQLRLERRDARWFLAVGLAFLAACLALRQAALGLSQAPLVQIVAEGLLILGWVGMWRPLEAVLYDWWPLVRRQRVLRRLAAIDVQVRTY
jgi:hypothetical protein